MVFSALDFNGNQLIAANVGDNSNMYQNLVTGDLTVSASDNIVFGALTAGVTQDNPQNITRVNINDYRGGSLAWTISGYSSLFDGAVSGSIPNSRLNWDPSQATNYNGENGADNAQIALGGLATLDQVRTFANGSTAASGEFVIYNALLNLSILASDVADDYNATLTFTVA